MRPQNLPHRRIALLASLIHHRPNLFSDIIGAASVEEYHDLLNLPLSPFWTTNYNFSTWYDPDSGKPSGLSRQSLNTIIINAVAPLLHSYGTLYNKPALRERAIELLEKLPPEHNSPVDLLRKAGFPCTNAFESQACLQLRREYCETRKCLRCRIGVKKMRVL